MVLAWESTFREPVDVEPTTLVEVLMLNTIANF